MCLPYWSTISIGAAWGYRCKRIPRIIWTVMPNKSRVLPEDTNKETQDQHKHLCGSNFSCKFSRPSENLSKNHRVRCYQHGPAATQGSRVVAWTFMRWRVFSFCLTMVFWRLRPMRERRYTWFLFLTILKLEYFNISNGHYRFLGHSIIMYFCSIRMSMFSTVFQNWRRHENSSSWFWVAKVDLYILSWYILW